MDKNRQRLQELYDNDAKLALVGHVESEDTPEIKTDVTAEDEPERPPQRTEKSIFTVTEDEQLQEELGIQSSMDERENRFADAREQREQSDLDLESEMEREMTAQSAEEEGGDRRELADSTSNDPPTSKESNPRDPAAQNTAISTTTEILEEGYEKRYMTRAQDREIRTAARREQQKQKELEEQAAKEAAEAEAAKQAEEEAEGHRVVERALLEEEEARAKKILAEKCRIRGVNCTT